MDTPVKKCSVWRCIYNMFIITSAVIICLLAGLIVYAVVLSPMVVCLGDPLPSSSSGQNNEILVESPQPTVALKRIEK